MKMFNANTVESLKASLAFANIQWPFGTFFIEGKSGTACTVLTDSGLISFVKRTAACSSLNHFNCEYKSK